MYRQLLYLLVLVLSPHLATCQERRDLSTQRCSYDVDCKNNSFCFGNDLGERGSCKCKEGFRLFGNHTFYECLEAIESVGSSCILDEQCELTLGKSSECAITNTCKCLPSAHLVPSKNSCYKTSRLNETCLSSENCLSQQGEQLHCTYGRCTCGLNEHPTADGRCVKTVHLGSTCETDNQCLHLDAVCRIVCDCRVGYVVANDQHNCLKGAVELNDPCVQLSQCNSYLHHTVCASEQCQCEGGYHSYGNACYINKFTGDSCENSKECIRSKRLEGLVDCVKGVCTCTSGGDPDRDCEPNNGSVLLLNHLLGFFVAVVLFAII